MLILSSPSENYGDAKGCYKIVANNKEKWRHKLQSTMVKSIEELCRDELKNYGYSFEYKGKIKKLSRLKMGYLKIFDGINLLLNDTGKQGIWRNLLFHLRYTSTSGNKIKF